MINLKWCCLSESNQQPIDYKSIALPVELRQHFLNHTIYFWKRNQEKI